MAAVTVRPMKLADLDAAAAIEATALDAWSRDSLEEELLNQLHGSGVPRLFVAEENGRVAALAAFQLVLDELTLNTVTVDLALRGQGIGRCLLESAFAALRAEGPCTCFLEVREHNAPAIALYEHLGFVRAGRRRGFYQNPADDALVMTLAL